jgi:hypothetical protein
MRLIYFLILLTASLSGQEPRETMSKYWIIEDPSKLIIFNQYEQRLTELEKTTLPGYSAWRILEEDYAFSDQFTHTAKAGLNKKIFYIQLSDDGEPVNKDLAGEFDIIKNARILGDTVRIKTNGRLSLQSGVNQTPLIEGMLVERLFRYRNKTFGKDIAGNVSGWIVGNGPENWEIYIPDKSDLALENQIFTRVDRIVTSYNTRLDKLFSFLNSHYGNSNPSPRWIVEKSPAYLKYVLTPQTYQKRFSGSQTYLIQELNDLLYGSIYQLSATDGQIVIIRPLN